MASAVGQIISFVISTAVGAALIRMAIANVRTGTANLNEMFSVTDILGPIIIGALLTTLVTYIGFALCIIPGFIAALGLAMTQPLIVDQKMQPVDAMKASWAALQPNLGSFFVLGLVVVLLNLAGAIPCGLGLFVTYPISIVALALVYRDLFGLGAGTTQPTGYIPPPIANPNF